MSRKIVGILISGLAWPALQYLVGLLRFGGSNPNLSYMAALRDFGLMGLVAGLLYFMLRDRAKNPRQQRFTTLGYWVASPFAFVGMLAGGLILPPILGSLLFGCVPLLIGGGLGNLVGGMGPAG
jgi:hypothetical protein